MEKKNKSSLAETVLLKGSFKSCPDDCPDKNKQACIYSQSELSYHRSRSGLKNHLLDKHTADTMNLSFFFYGEYAEQ